MIDWIQLVTFGIALLGATLGLLNTWRNFRQDRIRLKVVPKHATPIGTMDPRLEFCIEIINLSTFPLTIREVGVFYKGTKHRGAIVTPVLLDHGRLPRRLEPRSSLSIYSQLPTAPPGKKIRSAYATTSCRHTTTGTSGALKQIAGRHANNHH